MAPFHISATRRDIHNIRAAHSCSLPIRGEWLITHVDPLWWENKTYCWKKRLFDAMILSVWKMILLFVEFCFAKFQSYFFVTCICEFGQSLLVLLFFCLFNFYYLEKVEVQLSQRSRYCFSVFYARQRFQRSVCLFSWKLFVSDQW